MARNLIICGLDIGSHTVRAVVAEKKREGNVLTLAGVGESLSAGMRRGVVIDAESAAAAVRTACKAAEQSSGHKITSAHVGISGPHIVSRYVKGVVSVSRADQEVSQNDIARVIAQAQSIGAPPNKEVIHVFPKEYIVDGEGGIHDPFGMRGLRLETSALLIEGSGQVIKNIIKLVGAAGVEVRDITAASVAASYAALSLRQKELGVVLLDIGGTTSALAAFEEGKMIHAATLPVGSAHITNDIAIGLQTDIDAAEMIKMRYGVCRPETINKKEMIRFSSEDGFEQIDNISRKEVAEIIEARIEELFELADKELKKISRQALFPAGVVIVGGGANMTGMAEFAKNYLRLPAHVGVPHSIEGMTDYYASPQYAAAAGLCLRGAEEEEEREGWMLGGLIKKLFKAFLP